MLPDELVLCRNLRGASFSGANLQRVVFFGCDVTGALFRGATLNHCSFINCFSVPNGQRVDFAEASLTDTVEIESSISPANAPPHLFRTRWQTEVDSCATQLRSERNDVRWSAATSAAADPSIGRIIYPLLGCLLADDEWDVQSAALRSLAKIRETLTLFPRYDSELVERMLMLLGDASSFVRATAAQLVSVLRPYDDLLRRISNPTAQAPLTALRAAQTLLRLDAAYERLIDVGAIQAQARDGTEEEQLIAGDILESIR